jgi:hypothetical protein
MEMEDIGGGSLSGFANSTELNLTSTGTRATSWTNDACNTIADRRNTQDNMNPDIPLAELDQIASTQVHGYDRTGYTADEASQPSRAQSQEPRMTTYQGEDDDGMRMTGNDGVSAGYESALEQPEPLSSTLPSQDPPRTSTMLGYMRAVSDQSSTISPRGNKLVWIAMTAEQISSRNTNKKVKDVAGRPLAPATEQQQQQHEGFLGDSRPLSNMGPPPLSFPQVGPSPARQSGPGMRASPPMQFYPLGRNSEGHNGGSDLMNNKQTGGIRGHLSTIPSGSGSTIGQPSPSNATSLPSYSSTLVRLRPESQTPKTGGNLSNGQPSNLVVSGHQHYHHLS